MGSTLRIFGFLCITICFIPSPVRSATETAFNKIFVHGNQISSEFGNGIQFFAATRTYGWICAVESGVFLDGPTDIASVQAMAAFGINTVRIPINEACWLSINGVAFGGTPYKQAINNYLRVLTNNGFAAVLFLDVTSPGSSDTVQNSMPDAAHSITFWSQVASYFNTYTNIMYDLFENPTPNGDTFSSAAAWQCWATGAGCTESYPVAGMKQMLAAIRAVDSATPHVVIMQGIAGGNSMSSWLQYVPTDAQKSVIAGFQVLASDPCNSPSCWLSYGGLLTAPSVPVFWVVYDLSSACTCEISCEVIQYAYPTTGPPNTSVLVSVGYWDASIGCAAGGIITDYSGTPTATYGQQYQQTLQNYQPIN